MFECRTCVLRCVRAIAGDSIRQQSLAGTRLILTPRPLNTPSFRRLVSTVVERSSFDGAEDELAPGVQPIEEPQDGSHHVRSKQTGITLRNEQSLRTELRYLGDPLKLAQHVLYTLRCDNPEKALNLCRLASKSDSVIVSWNHCINWHMGRGDINQAIKIYNEMKKRAQFPDSYTYTLLLKGLAQPERPGQIVGGGRVVKAVSIYNSMSSPTSRVQPSIIHTNAVLKVCSEALDTDALWGIASKIPPHGPNAADHKTYAILLNAIRHGAFGRNPEHVYLEQIAVRRNQAVQEGRRVWQEVIAKWRSGEIHVDEELVCAMGRLLLFSKRMRDWDDVLSLIQQTMKIERQIAPIGSEGRYVEHIPLDDEAKRSDPDPEADEDSDGYTDVPSVKTFNPVTPLPRASSKPEQSATLAYVQPGNRTLSILIGTCSLLRMPKIALAYWDLLTDPAGFALKPDLANFHAQLRLLSKNRASARAVALLKQGLPSADIDPTKDTFRIAMAVCARDMKNPKVLDNARQIVDMMEKALPNPDVQTLKNYLSLALTTNDGPKIAATVDRLDSFVHNLRSRINYGTEPTQSEATKKRRERPMTADDHLTDKENTVSFFQALVGAMDNLIRRHLVPDVEWGQWDARRKQLTAIIGRSKDRLEKQRRRTTIVPVSVRSNWVGRTAGRMAEVEVRRD